MVLGGRVSFWGTMAIKISFGHTFRMTLGSFGNQGDCHQGRDFILFD